jgi:hypothetical protein
VRKPPVIDQLAVVAVERQDDAILTHRTRKHLGVFAPRRVLCHGGDILPGVSQPPNA